MSPRAATQGADALSKILKCQYPSTSILNLCSHYILTCENFWTCDSQQTTPKALGIDIGRVSGRGCFEVALRAPMFMHLL
jgi:hypothetical protein